MAAHEDGLSSRCISLLEEVKVLLENQGSTGNPNQISSSSHGSNASVSNVSRRAENNAHGSTIIRVQGSSPPTLTSTASNPDPKPEHRPERVIENFRSLFSPYGSSATNTWLRPPPGKKPKKGHFQVKETWTHEFFCLSRTNATGVPSRMEKIKLQNSGLGRKKVVFSCKATALEVQRVLESTYPKLGETGGFELLRSGSPCSSLVLINPPATGYSVPFLRDSAGLGQALAYIRPLQKDLDTDTVCLENRGRG